MYKNDPFRVYNKTYNEYIAICHPQGNFGQLLDILVKHYT